MILAYVLSDTCSYIIEEPLGKSHKIETIKRLNRYILAYQAIIRSYIKLSSFYIRALLYLLYPIKRYQNFMSDFLYFNARVLPGEVG